MLSYKEYEKKVYDWLMAKHQSNNDFTFSVRQNGGGETKKDYFIGTEKSNYFSTTFWTIPVGFPGSSGDCMSLQFNYTKTGYVYFFEFSQTRNPKAGQNTFVLNLVTSLINPLKSLMGLKRELNDDTKMLTLRTNPGQNNYDSFDNMIIDVEKDLDVIFPLVDEYILKEKSKNPTFEANRISKSVFDKMQQKMFERFEKNSSDDFKEDSGIKYWLYAPGEKANKWDAFYEQGIMGLGWDALGNLNTYKTKNEIQKKLQEIDSLDSSKQNDTAANYEFVQVMNPGDIVIAKKGRSDFLGYGVVTSDVIFDNNRAEYKNYRKVDWKKRGVWSVEKRDIVLKTLTNITKYPNYVNELIDLLGIDEVQSNKNGKPMIMNHPLNQILYGPPGTGKTYNTVLEAAKIITGNNTISYDEALDVFNNNLHDQIEFITFHQNYSYEDFIQGIRPDTENGKELSFEKKDGVFKRIADRALENLEQSKTNGVSKLPFREVFNAFAQPLIEGEVNEVTVPMKRTSYIITDFTEKTIFFKKNSGGTDHSLSRATLEKMYNQENTGSIQGLTSYYEPLLNLLLENGKKGKVEQVVKKNYVIIIDEINRANISRVFGELITLIEEDKRSQGKIPMRVTLPSGDSFIVPSNLYIIGTMNTADKSIALLDIALRRRFEFIPKYPDATLENVNEKDVLLAINKAIVDRKNHDFTIGHAYFMGNGFSLEKTINNKVIPLLHEYFMNDEKEVTAILKAAGVDVEGWPMKMKPRD